MTCKRTPRFSSVPALLVVGMLFLSACNAGGTSNNGGTSDATPTVVEGDTTPTETVSAEATPTTEESTSTTETVTDTQTITDTGTMTGTEVSPDSTPMSETGTMTGTDTMTDTGTVTGASMNGVSGANGMLVRASTLTDYDFVNQDGAVSGNVDDFLVDVSTGNILFAFVEYGGLLDIGDTNLVMPLSAFQMGDNQLILNFDEQELTSFPNVGDNWPDINDPVWDDEVNSFWRNINIDPGFDFNETNSSSVMWLSDMTGYTLTDLGAGNGTIQDVLVDLENSRIKYVLFDFGDAAASDTPFIVPYSVLDVQNLADNQIAFSSSLDLETLQTAPRFDPALYPGDVLTPDFSTAIDEYWMEKGFDVK